MKVQLRTQRALFGVWMVLLIALLAGAPAHGAPIPVQDAFNSASPSYSTADAVAERDAVVDFEYKESPVANPPLSGSSTASELSQAYEAIPETTEVSKRAAFRDFLDVATKAKLMPALEVPDMTLPLGTLALGWQVGDQINGRFLHIGVPAAGPTGASAYLSNPQHVTFERAGTTMCSAKGPATLPADGWILFYGTVCGLSKDARDSYGCHIDPTPQEFHQVANGTYQCYSGWPYQCCDPGGYVSYYADPDKFNPVGPIRAPRPGDVVDINSPAPTTPTRTSVTSSVTTSVTDGQHQGFDDWLNYQLKVPGAQDPFTGKVIVPDCSGLQYAACSSELADMGFQNVQRVDMAAWATQVDLAAGEVASVQDAGEGHDPAAVEDVAVNPDPKPDPAPSAVYIDDDTDRCDITPGGLGYDPNGDTHPWFSAKETNFAVSPPNNASTPTTFLPWGTTWLLDGDWRGFGYAKIAAKHGWSDEDRAQTISVLSDPLHLYVHQDNGRDLYLGSAKRGQAYWTISGGVVRFCIRAVVIEPRAGLTVTRTTDQAQQTMDPSLTQAGIWTTFGKDVTTP